MTAMKKCSKIVIAELLRFSKFIAVEQTREYSCVGILSF